MGDSGSYDALFIEKWAKYGISSYFSDMQLVL